MSLSLTFPEIGEKTALLGAINTGTLLALTRNVNNFPLLNVVFFSYTLAGIQGVFDILILELQQTYSALSGFWFPYIFNFGLWELMFVSFSNTIGGLGYSLLAGTGITALSVVSTFAVKSFNKTKQYSS